MDEASDDHAVRLRGHDSNPSGASGPQMWATFRDAVAYLYDLSLPSPAEEQRFTIRARAYPLARATMVRGRGTAHIMHRGPEQIAKGSDQILIYLQQEGIVDTICGTRRARVGPGDVVIFDYAEPLQSTVTDYGNLFLVLMRDAVPAALLAARPHGMVLPADSGPARLISNALETFFENAERLSISEGNAAVDGIVSLTAALVGARYQNEQTDQNGTKRQAALACINERLGDLSLGPDEIASALNISRASLYRLMAAEGGIRAVLLKQRLDTALQIILADKFDARTLSDVARKCGFGGAAQFSRAFRARFGFPPRQYRNLIRKQDVEWLKTRLRQEGFESDPLVQGD